MMILPRSLQGRLLVLVIGGAAAFFMMGGKGKKGDDHAEEKVEAKTPTFVVIEPFVVNLQQETGDQYLQVAMTLQVPDGQTAEALKLYMPQVRSRLLMVLPDGSLQHCAGSTSRSIKRRRCTLL